VCDLALGPFTAGTASTPSWFDYLAPEQRAPRAEDSAAVDVFASAAMLVEMLTLSPGPRADARETWGQFVREAKGTAVAERLATLRKDVPRPVWDVVATGLALAYGASKFIMGNVSDRSNPRRRSSEGEVSEGMRG
jgi:hypothetical protein